jgi:hypothetical protein
MDQLARVKDTIFGLFSPRRPTSKPDPKRRRTVGPVTPSKDLSQEDLYQTVSEPRGEKAQAALYRRITGKYLAQPATNPRKRAWEDGTEEGTDDTGMAEGEELVEEDDEDEEDAEEEHDSGDESLSPDNSASQITPIEDEASADSEGDMEGIEGEDDYEEEYGPAQDPDAIAQAKVEAYLATQHELTIQREAIEKVKAQGDWHPSEIYLFERLSLRSYEVLIPQEWQIDFPTLPGDIFARDKNSVLINYNCLPSIHGKLSEPLSVPFN